MHAQDVLDFWFVEIDPTLWFAKSDDLDGKIRSRFEQIHQAALACELFAWRTEPLGRLAEIIVLDQFSRNLYRDQAMAFAGDPLALALAQELIAQGLDAGMSVDQKRFAYMPFMHSESTTIHEIALDLFAAAGLEDNLKFEQAHKAIIDRFGRYPHRNVALGRTSTPEEVEFLQGPGSSF